MTGPSGAFPWFLVILVAIHALVDALVVFGMGRWRKIEIETLCGVSHATVGGPSRGPCDLREVRRLATPSVLLGILSYATGSYIWVGMA